MTRTAAVTSPADVVNRVLRGDACAWPWPADQSAARAFLDEAARHHVEPLLAFHLKASLSTADWPSSVLETLDASLRRHALREVLFQNELVLVLEALGRASLPAVLMKGSALAYTTYPAPALRRRNDTDILIDRADLDRVAVVLAGVGYRRENYLIGDRVSHQALFTRTGPHGVVHNLDVHWRVSNRPVFEDVLTWDEVLAGSVPVPALGVHARATGTAHALMLACIHPVAHHGQFAEDTLRWIYDVHLLASAMNDYEFQQWVDLVTTRAMRAVCGRGLHLAHERFRTDVPPWVTAACASAPDEPSAWYLSDEPWKGDVRLSDLRTTTGIRAKTGLILEVVLPKPAYMQQAYGVSNRVLLVPFYVYRVVRGSWRLLCRLMN
jgi:hypothetical protein